MAFQKQPGKRDPFPIDKGAFDHSPFKSPKAKAEMKEAKTKDGQRRLVFPELRPKREPFRNLPEHLPSGWQEDVIYELRKRPIISRAARLADVSRRTVVKYREIDPEFDAACEDAINEGKEHILELVMEMAENGNVHAALSLSRRWNGSEEASKETDKKVSVKWEE